MTHDHPITPAAFREYQAATEPHLDVRKGTSKAKLGDHIHLEEQLPHRGEYTDRSITFRVRAIEPLADQVTLRLHLDPIQDGRGRKVGYRTPQERAPEGWTIAAVVKTASPASITLEDANGEPHVLQGEAWVPDLEEGDTVTLRMTRAGFRIEKGDA